MDGLRRRIKLGMGVGAGALVLCAVMVTQLGSGSHPTAGGRGTSSGDGAGGATVLAVGKVDQLDQPGVVLAQPVDGRLNGPDFQLSVAGAARVGSAGAGSEVVRAPRGYEVEVFELDSSETNQSPGVSLAVGYGDHRWALPNSVVAGGTTSDLAFDVPAHQPAVLSASGDGPAQTFDLSAGRRVGAQPTVLYRDPTSPSLTDSVNAGVTDSTDYNDGTVDINITVSDVSLQYLSPTGQAPPRADEAWVVPEMSAFTQPSGPIFTFLPAPGSWVHLVLPNGTSIPAQTQPISDGNDLLSADYWFLAPADITNAKLVFGPGTVSGDTGVFNGDIVPVSIPNPLAVDLSFPSYPAPLVPKRSASAARKGSRHAGLVRTPGPGRASSTPWAVVGGGLGGLLVSLLGTVLLVRRRRRRDRGWTSADGVVIDIRSRAVGPQPRPRALELAEALAQAGPPGMLAPPAGDPMAIPVGPSGRSETVGSTGPSARTGPAEEPAVVWVKVLGARPEVIGPGVERLSPQAEEVLVFLALHRGRSFSPSALGAELRPRSKRRPDARTLSTYVSRARQVLPPGAIPDGKSWKGYQLVGEQVRCDWDEIVRQASRAERLYGQDARPALEAALGLVADRPFSAVSESEWPWVRDWSDRAEVLVESLAHRLAQLHLQAGRFHEALDAAHAGLAGTTCSIELTGDAIEAAAMVGAAELTRELAEGNARLGDAMTLLDERIGRPVAGW